MGIDDRLYRVRVAGEALGEEALEPRETHGGWMGMRHIRPLGIGFLIAAALQAPPALAGSGSCVCLAVGTGIVQEPFEKDPLSDGEFAARLGVFHSLFGPLEAGIEGGYLGLGRAISPFCGETGTLPCEFEGNRLNSFDMTASLRWRPKLGPVRPYVAAGVGVFAVKGGKYTDDALLRETRGGISTAIGVHSARAPRLGAEVRWVSILDTAGYSWNRNTDVLTLMVGLSLD